MKNQRFDEALLKAIDTAFGSLGRSCEKALYFHLENTFHIEKAEIPEKVEEFDSAMRMIFKEGAAFLERLILEKLLEELGMTLDRKPCSDFAETISEVKNMFSKKESSLTVSDLSGEVDLVKNNGGVMAWDGGLGYSLLTMM